MAKLYGKIGNRSQLGADGNKIKDRHVVWFVVFVRKGEKVIIFVQLPMKIGKTHTPPCK